MKWIGSPNYTIAPFKVRKIVLHWMAGTLAGTDAQFRSPYSGVSAHYGVENTTVHQYVRENHIAWHAIDANSFAIGIEHSAAPGRSATKATLETSAKLCADICKRHKLNPLTDIEVHNKYVNTRCPGTNNAGKILEAGGLDVNYIRKRANEIMKGEQDMATTKSINIVRRFYLGAKPISKTSMNNYKKMTTTKMIERITSSSDIKANIALAKQGKLNVAEHLPVEYRNAYKDPAPALHKQLSDTQTALKQSVAALDAARKAGAMSENLKRQLKASQAESEKRLKEIERLKEERASDEATGNAFIRWLGSLFNKGE